MTDKAWKQFERRICEKFGGKRRGAYVHDGIHSKNDCVAHGWSIEAKLLKRPHYQSMLDACKQAEQNRESKWDIPVAIVKRKNDHDVNALVCMRLEEFARWFVQ